MDKKKYICENYGDQCEEIKEIIKLAIEDYQRKLNSFFEQCEIMKDKKFHMNDIVIKKGTSYFDNVFGTGDGNVGKIVGWDNDYNYYRVRYNDYNPFVGVTEDKLELFDGDIPEHLLQHKRLQIKSVRVGLS